MLHVLNGILHSLQGILPQDLLRQDAFLRNMGAEKILPLAASLGG